MSKLAIGICALGLATGTLLLSSCGAFHSESYSTDTAQASFMNGDYQTAFKELQPAATHGDPDAQYAVGYMYYYGLGTTQDRKQAISWMQKAAKNGQPLAQQALRSIQNGTMSSPYAPRRSGGGYRVYRGSGSSGPDPMVKREEGEGAEHGQGVNSAKMMSSWPRSATPTSQSTPVAPSNSQAAPEAATGGGTSIY